MAPKKKDPRLVREVIEGHTIIDPLELRRQLCAVLCQHSAELVIVDLAIAYQLQHISYRIVVTECLL